jgi:GTP cyclohydrolase I
MSAVAPRAHPEPISSATEPATEPAGDRLELAFAELLAALAAGSTKASRSDLCQTPQRAAALWRTHLLAGEGRDLAEVLGTPLRHVGSAPIILRQMGIHLVCPHHLTVAWGKAHLAYLPAGQVAGAGRLCDLIQACTARFVLQEEAAQQICTALVDQLQAHAVVALLEAVHPCHTVTQPQSHGAQLACWGQSGEPREVRLLQRLLHPGPDAGPAPTPRRRPRRLRLR